jgi:hypothetical protein
VRASPGDPGGLAPRLDVEDGGNAVRMLFSRLGFDQTRAREGVDHLRLYRAMHDEKRKILHQRPRHDEHRHAAETRRTFTAPSPRSRQGPLAAYHGKNFLNDVLCFLGFRR